MKHEKGFISFIVIIVILQIAGLTVNFVRDASRVLAPILVKDAVVTMAPDQCC